MKPLLVVFGGTGKKGKSVIKSILNDGTFQVRTLTRNANDPKAQKLSSKGVQIMEGNIHNIDDLRRVLNGAYAVFASVPWGKDADNESEEDLGKKIGKISRESGIRHFIWSTFPNVEKITRGEFDVPHFTATARVNRWIKNLGFEYYTFVLPSFFYQNFADLIPRRTEGGTLIWTIPMSEKSFLSAMDVRDLGPVVNTILHSPKEFHRQKIRLVGDILHPQDFIIKIGLTTKRPTKVELITPEGYFRMGNPKELADMFAYFEKYPYMGKEENWPEISKKLYPRMKNWEEYLGQYAVQSS